MRVMCLFIEVAQSRDQRAAAEASSVEGGREIERRKPEVIEAVAVAEAEPVAEPVPMPAKPRLAASNPMGNLPQVMADILEPGRGKIEIAKLHTAYVEACEARSILSIPANEFPAAIAALCETLKIEIKRVGEGVYLMRAKLKTRKSHSGRALQQPRALWRRGATMTLAPLGPVPRLGTPPNGGRSRSAGQAVELALGWSRLSIRRKAPTPRKSLASRLLVGAWCGAGIVPRLKWG